MVKESSDIRVCFIGDSMVNGTGDPEYLGWVGRLCRQACQQGWGLTAYNLGVRRETSLQVERRWESEAICRLAGVRDGRVVFSFGVNDTTVELGSLRVTPEDSAAALQRILSKARDRYPVLVVGPPAIADPDQNQRILALSQRYAQISHELGISYLETCAPLSQSPIWLKEAQANDGAHPQAQGYAELAQLVSQWTAWQEWFPDNRPNHA